MFLKLLLSYSLILFFSINLLASTFAIEAEWYVDNKLISKSEIQALDNEEASVEVGDELGDLSYLQVIATSDNIIQPKNAIKMDFEVGQIYRGTKTIISHPSLLVKSGESASIKIVDAKKQKVEIKVKATKLN